MSGHPLDLLRMPAREREALAASLEAVARLLRGDLPGSAVKADDELLAPELLRAWWLELGSEAVGVAKLFEVSPQTKLGALLADLVDELGGDVHQAKTRLGQKLRGFERARRDFGGYRVRSLGPYCGSQTWVCEPIEPPQPPTAAGAG